VETVAAALFHSCRGKTEDECEEHVEAAVPLVNWLWEQDKRPRAKTEFLFELQAAAYNAKLPRLSPATSVLEAIFDKLYMLDVIEEGYFHMWVDNADDDRPGKIDSMFSINLWLEWLRTAKVEGEDSDSDEDESGSGDDDSDSDEDDSDEDDDIEALVPTRGKPMIRPA
jgi:hypothetical protein